MSGFFNMGGISELQLHIHRHTGAVGGEGGFHDLHIHHHLVMGDDLLLLPVDGLDEVAVEIMHIGGRLGDLLGGDGFLVPGCHGLGDAGRRSDRNHILLAVVVAPHHPGGHGPVRDQGGAVGTGHVEPGHIDEVGGADLHMGGQVAVKVHFQLEAVVHQLIGDMVTLAPDLPQGAVGDDAHDLVDEVNAPVQDHAAAMLRLLPPVAGDAPGAVDTGLDMVYLPQFSAAVDVPHEQKFPIPPAVLVNREEAAILVGRIDHLLQILGAQRDRFLADDMLARRHGLDGQGLVQVVGDGNGDKIHRRVVQKSLKGGVRMDAVLFGDLAPLRLYIVDTHQIDHIAPLHVIGVPGTHAAVADDGRILLCHIKNSFLNLTSDTGGRPSAPSAAPIIQHLHEKCKVF